MIYLDHAATTPMRPEVWDAMAPFASEAFGNPSGSHGVSRKAKNALEEAREEAASMLGCRPMEIVFTGGGTEADALAIQGRAVGGGGVVTTSVEHEAVLESADFLGRRGSRVVRIPVDRQGMVDPDRVVEAVDASTAVVSVMAANNETGAVLPVGEIAGRVKAKWPQVPVHTDAVQYYVASDISVDEWGIDMLSLSAHKFGGPKGVGLLYVREGTGLEPVLHGGGQELGRRSGTQNVMGVAGMVAAMRCSQQERARFLSNVGEARRGFEEALAGVAVRTIDDRLLQHSHLRFPGFNNEILVIRLDQRGVAASTASACQSGASKVSHVLTAMGYTATEARECLRFTFGWTTTPEEGRRAGKIVLEALR